MSCLAEGTVCINMSRGKGKAMRTRGRYQGRKERQGSHCSFSDSGKVSGRQGADHLEEGRSSN